MPAQSVPAFDEKTVSFKKLKGMVIELTSDSGKLSVGPNNFCIVVRDKNATSAIVVQNVSVDFKLLAGRIHETPVTVQLSRNEDGRYCGIVNLQQQSSRPANYYAFVHFIDSNGKRRTTRFWLTIR